MTGIPTPSSDVGFYPFVDGGVLFLEGSRRIWVLNATSAFIWCLLYEVAGVDELCDRLVSTFPISKDKALQDITALLERLGRDDLFSQEPCLEDQESDPAWDIAAAGAGLVEPDQWTLIRMFRVGDHLFEFRCQDDTLGDEFARVMDHLTANGNGEVGTRLAVVRGRTAPETFDLYLDEVGFATGLPANEVLPHLATLVFVRCCQTLEPRLLFHAGVLEKDGAAIVLPGEAGSGKTTLVAALSAHGCTFFSDELAVVDVDAIKVFALPLPMSIKPGSVAPLEKFYPRLSDYWVHLRTDGKKVRYLTPTRHTLPAADCAPVPIDCLIFPKFEPTAQTRLAGIDKTDALQRLAATGSSNRAFTHKDVEAMIALVEGRPCCEMVYSDLEQAVKVIQAQIFEP